MFKLLSKKNKQHEHDPMRRRLAHPGRAVGANRSASSATQAASLGLSSTTGERLGSNECDFGRTAHRCPMERVERYRDLLEPFCASPVSGMVDAGVCEAFWRRGLLAVDMLQGIDWTWLSLDGAMTKAPLGMEKTGTNPTDRGNSGVKCSMLNDGQGMLLSLAIDGA